MSNEYKGLDDLELALKDVEKLLKLYEEKSIMKINDTVKIERLTDKFNDIARITNGLEFTNIKFISEDTIKRIKDAVGNYNKSIKIISDSIQPIKDMETKFVKIIDEKKLKENLSSPFVEIGKISNHIEEELRKAFENFNKNNGDE